MALPRPADMFGDANNSVEIAERFESYKSELNKSLASPQSAPGAPTMGQSPVADVQKALGSPELVKALSPELLDSVRNQLAQADIGKDLTNTSPISTGLVAFDLEAPAKLLVPRPTPLRNRIARRKGVGTAHRFKRITGFTGSGTGGVGLIRPGITDSTTTSFGSVSYLRGPKISYAGDDQAVNYKQFSVSDQVPWSAQFAGQGYEDIRQLSQTSVLWSSMLLEERMLLGGRGTDSGFSGALAAPSSLAFGTPGTPGTGQTGLSGVTTNIYVKLTSESIWGESVLSTSANVAISNGQVVTLTATLPAGATGMRVYIGTGASLPADSALWFYGRFGGGTAVIQGALPTSGTAASTVAADTSAAATDYDGILSYCMGSNAGYVKRINTTLNTGNPGAEFFTAFAAMYDSVKADPDEVLANGNDRKQLSDALKNSSSSNYQISLINAPGTEGVHDAKVGALVTGLQNEVTGKMVGLTVHPWLPQGTMPIISWTLPLPDSNISDVFAVYNVQDYTGVSWPVTQFAYESSSYWYGVMVCYAPAWCGAITGVTLA